MCAAGSGIGFTCGAQAPICAYLYCESHVWRVMANTNNGGNHLFGSAQSIKGIVPLFGSALRAQIKIFVPLLGFLSQPK